MSTLGKAVRIERLKNSGSGRILTVALDHAPSYGLLKGLEDIRGLLERVAAGGPDAVMLMKGPAERCFQPYAGRVALILKCSTLSPFHPEHDVWLSSVEDAVRLGADAISMAITIGSTQQPRILANLAALVREAEKAAMGVDIVKTFYTGSSESFAEVVARAAPALVVAAGGPRLNTEADVLTMAHGAVEAGAAGITFGRNIWQSERVFQTIRALKLVVHGNRSVEEALDSMREQVGGTTGGAAKVRPA